uniref:Thioredoxin domain-containing protein n=1 Tax=viral metagenome TaxID=1070528 RepID=A0A6C0DWZ2_9ZZZZ
MSKTNFFKVISKQFSLKKPETFLYLAIVFILLYLVANYVLPSNMLFKENFELFNSSPSPSAMTSDNSTKLVYFYMDGCGHCNKFTPTWNKFCSANSTSIKTYKFEQAQVKDQITTYAISGFPTILLLDKNNAKIDEYNGERSVEALTSYVNDRASHS